MRSVSKSSQPPRDRILWILANGGGKLKRSMGMRYADLDLLLEELVKEGRISRLPSSTGKEMITIKER